MTRPTNTRAHSRYEIRISAEVATGGQVYVCTTRDLSEGGVGLSCDREIPTQNQAFVTLFVVVDDIEDLGTRPLELEGKIVWCREVNEERHDAGLQFGPMDESKSRYLKRLLAASRRE
jgi:c-di-GMP-binding flagellar brake protein YcgR